jgi:hypothetical protein
MRIGTNACLIAFLCGALAGCGGDGGGAGGSGGSGGTRTGDDVGDALTDLGVDVTETARQGDDMEALPDDYSPFGSARAFDVNEELAMLGIALADSAFSDRGLTLMELDRVGSNAIYTDDALFTPEPATTPWAASVGDDPGNLRNASRGDFDGDGLEELAVVHRAEGQSAIQLQIYEDETQAFATGQLLTVSSDAATSLSIASGDFNGDGLSDLVVGLATSDAAKLLLIDNDEGTLSVSATVIDLPQSAPNSVIDLSIATGNLDYDPSHELVVLVNETFGAPEQGTTRYYVFDDGKAGFTAITDDLVRANLDSVNRTAIVADVALGDVDGDNLDEIIFAGLTNFDPNGTCSYNYLLVALDDLVRNRAPIGAAEHQPNIHGGCAAGELRYVHVNTLDIDGDGVPEIQANELVYDDFALGPWTRLIAPTAPMPGSEAEVEIPHASLFANDGGFSGRFDARNSAMVTADLTADGRQDIIFYSQATNQLEVWGLSDLITDPPGPPVQVGQWRMLKGIEIEPPESDAPVRPVLVSANVNHDSLSISFDEGEYQLVFTEPVLIAALAAAPCFSDLGQNTDACRTEFGTAESTTVAIEDTFTVTAGVTVGFESEFSVLGVKGVGLEILATVKARASRIKSEAYTLTKRIVYTTGPIEDTVLFTTIPLDQYTYTITSHPDPELINSKIVVSMPRSPVEIQVERAFYNANVVPGGPMIDASVFTHELGNPLSYPSQSDKDAALDQYDGFEVGPATVGGGGGATTLEINVANESGTGAAYGVEAELEVQATAGVVVAGFSVGIDKESSLQIVHGEESSYVGTVSNLPTETFAANGYDWGLFTYIFDDHASGQEFEVINYWVP